MSEESRQLLPGTILVETYEIIECIHSSDFCNVYIAEDVDDKKVIIKELFEAGIESKYREEAIKKFQEEAKVYTELRHENIVSIKEIFFSTSAISMENRQFIVMEYVEGKTLRQIKEEKKDHLSPEELLPWIEEICKGLTYLSEQTPPLIFYYLSPDHVLITGEGKVKLINFGLGRYFKPGPFKSNQYMGVPGYAAPEQYGIKEITPGADIFGLGAIIYYMLTGDDPGEHPLKFAPARQLNPLLSLPLARFITQSLQMKPEERVATCLEFIEKLKTLPLVDTQISPDMIKKKKKEAEVLYETKPLQAVGKVATGWHERLSWTAEKYLPSSKRVPFLIGLFIVSIVAFLLVRHFTSENSFPHYLLYVSQINTDSLAVLDTEKKEVFKTLSTGECRSRMILFDDKIYIGGPVSNLIVIDSKKVEIEEDIKIDFNAVEFVITKDGGAIYLSDTSGGQVAKVLPETKSVPSTVKVGTAPLGLALSQNEHFLYVANFNSNSISVVDTTDNTILQTIENAGKNPRKLLVIPDTKLLYCLNWGGNDITVINTANNTIKEKIQVEMAPGDIVLSPDKKTVYVSNNKGQSISIIDVLQGAVTGEIKLPDQPNCICLSADNKNLFISVSDSKRENNRILIMDLDKKELTGEISLKKCSLSILEIKGR